MKTYLTIVILIVAVIYPSVMVFAERLASKPVKDVHYKGIRYSAPKNLIGCVVASKESPSYLLWWKQIYVVKYNFPLESDVQTVFITNLKIENDKLIIENEKGYTYSLDPNSLEVQVINGEAIIGAHAENQRPHGRCNTKTPEPNR